jgi:hypothetical protein
VIARRTALLLLPAGLFGMHRARAQSLSLTGGEVLRGRFTQQRHLQGFAQPLTSAGSFVLAPERGVAWRGETPFATMTVIGPGGLVQRVSGGATTHYPASRLPAIATLYDIFGSALSGDWQKLTSLFDVRREGSEARWTVTLTPLRAADGALPISKVTVQGSRYVDAVEVRRTNGDWDRIEFSQQTPSRLVVDGETAELFAMVNRR